MSENDTKFEYYKRDFLNPGAEGMAAFEAKIELSKYGYLYGQFAITDCSRKVCLDFDADDADEMSKRKSKIRLLIEELQQFEAKFFEALEIKKAIDSQNKIKQEKENETD